MVLWVLIISNTLGLSNAEEQVYRNKIIPVYLPIVFMSLAFLILKKTFYPTRDSYRCASLNTPIVILLSYSLLSILWSPCLEYSLILFAILGTNILLFYTIFFSIENKEQHYKLMLTWFLGGIICTVLTIVSIIIHPQIEMATDTSHMLELVFRYNPKVQTRGYALTHPGNTGMSINMGIAITIGLLLSCKTKLARVILGGAAILMVFANCLTFSKAALGSLLMLGIYFLIFSHRLRKRFFILLPSYIILFIGMRYAAVIFADIFGEPFHAQIMESSGQVMSAGQRLSIWGEGFKYLAQKGAHVWGLGLGGYDYLSTWPHAHNVYFSLYFDFGVIGFIFMLLIFKELSIKFYKIGKGLLYQTTYLQTMSMAFSAGLFAVCIQSLVDNMYYKPVLWLFLPFVLVTYGLTIQERNALKEKMSNKVFYEQETR